VAEVKSNPGEGNPEDLAPICSFRGFRAEVMRRSFQKLDALDQQGLPSWDQLGPAVRSSFEEVRKEAEESCGPASAEVQQ
jgi:hypothetical protein